MGCAVTGHHGDVGLIRGEDNAKEGCTIWKDLLGECETV